MLDRSTTRPCAARPSAPRAESSRSATGQSPNVGCSVDPILFCHRISAVGPSRRAWLLPMVQRMDLAITMPAGRQYQIAREKGRIGSGGDDAVRPFCRICRPVEPDCQCNACQRPGEAFSDVSGRIGQVQVSEPPWVAIGIQRQTRVTWGMRRSMTWKAGSARPIGSKPLVAAAHTGGLPACQNDAEGFQSCIAPPRFPAIFGISPAGVKHPNIEMPAPSSTDNAALSMATSGKAGPRYSAGTELNAKKVCNRW